MASKTLVHARAAKRPRALIVVENMSFPQDRRVWLEATALRADGFDVSVICPNSRRKPAPAFERLQGIDVYRFTLPETSTGVRSYLVEYSLAFLNVARLALRVQRRTGFDVLQVCNPPDIFFPLGWASKLLGKAFIFDQHDLTPETFCVQYGEQGLAARLIGGVLSLCERLTVQTADAMLTTNESFRRRALRRGGSAPERIFVVRNGPNEERMRRVEPDPALKRGRRWLACYVGMMGPQDGVEYALHAAKRVLEALGPDAVTFAFLGAGESLPGLQALALELGIGANVEFTGFVDGPTLMRYLSTADVGLAPDPQNGLNEHLTTIKVLEYMAVGLPVVAFDLAETRYSAQDAAVYAPANDVAAFAALIADLCQDSERRARLGQRGRARIQQYLSWRFSQVHLRAAYRQVLGLPAAEEPDGDQDAAQHERKAS